MRNTIIKHATSAGNIVSQIKFYYGGKLTKYVYLTCGLGSGWGWNNRKHKFLFCNVKILREQAIILVLEEPDATYALTKNMHELQTSNCKLVE